MRILKKTLLFFLFAGVAAGVFYGVTCGLRAFTDDTEEDRPRKSQKATPTVAAATPTASPVPDDAIPYTGSGEVLLLGDVHLPELIEKVLPCIVQVESDVTGYDDWGRQNVGSTQGSGIILALENDTLYIATNNHVVSDATKITVTFADGSTAEVSLLGADEVGDLAILTVPYDKLADTSKSAIAVATLAQDTEPHCGEMVFAVGNSLGRGTSVTVGYVSAVERVVETTVGPMELIQTDAAINPGNSGGALVNLRGEVIGINSAKYSARSVESMGFAIPVSQAIPILAELKKTEHFPTEEAGYLGVYITAVTTGMQEDFGWPRGVYVKAVVPGGSAEAAGILSGDIILSVNDIRVYETSQLINRVTSYRAGTVIQVRISREQDGNREEIVIPVTLMEREKLPDE